MTVNSYSISCSVSLYGILLKSIPTISCFFCVYVTSRYITVPYYLIITWWSYIILTDSTRSCTTDSLQWCTKSHFQIQHSVDIKASNKVWSFNHDLLPSRQRHLAAINHNCPMTHHCRNIYWNRQDWPPQLQRCISEKIAFSHQLQQTSFFLAFWCDKCHIVCSN